MPLFQRKTRTVKLAEAVAQELAKANSMSSTPLNGSGYTTSAIANPAGIGVQGQGSGTNLLSALINTTPLPRLPDAFGSQLGPSAPFLPQALDPVLDTTGRALPRLYEYPVAWNLNLSNERQNVPWSILRALADQCDIIHRCIEIKIAEVIKMGWSITLSDEALSEIMATENVSHAKASKIGRERYGDEIARLTRFWENPYPQADRTWSEWITEFLWQHLVFDGVPVYPRLNLAGEVIGFEIIDAPTIKVLLDNRGGMPQPPNPAFQQILWGFPRGEYETSINADGEYYAGAGSNGEYLTDQLAYFVRNRRTWSPYGYSAVEASVPAATIYLERQKWMKAEYSEGTLPLTFMKTDSTEMDPYKLAQFERVFNDKLIGSTAERNRIKVLPQGFDPMIPPTMAERFSPDYDEFIIKRILGFFGVSPTAVGLTPRNGIGGSGQQDGEAESADVIGIRPMESFLVDMINSLCRRFLQADKNVTFVLSDHHNAVDEQAIAQANQTALFSGAKTLNDVRGEMGLPLYDMPEADEPFIVSGTPTFLKNTLEAPVAPANALPDTLPPVTDQALQENASEPVANDQPVSPPATEQVKQANSEMAEIFAFTRFVEKRVKAGSWRDFNFTLVDPETAERMNNEGRQIVAEGLAPRDIPKVGSSSISKRAVEDLPLHKYRQKAIDHFVPLIRKALRNSITGLDKAIDQILKHPEIFEKGVTADIVKIDANVLRAITSSAMNNVSLDPKQLENVLLNLYGVGNLLGTKSVMDVTGRGAVIGSGLDGLVAGINWDTWEPGDPELASNIRIMSDLPFQRNLAGHTIKGINSKTLDLIDNEIANAIATGGSARDITRALRAIAKNPASAFDERRASSIGVTELARAYSIGTRQEMMKARLTKWKWLDYEGACEKCASKASAPFYGLQDPLPPAHPFCRCIMDPIIESLGPQPQIVATLPPDQADPLYASWLGNFADDYVAGGMDIASSSRGANPNYKPSVRDYSANCARVVQAYELRRRGYAVEAGMRPNVSDQFWRRYTGELWEVTRDQINLPLADQIAQKIHMTVEPAKTAKDGIARYKGIVKVIKKTYPEGARGQISWQWKNARVGHVVSWEIENGEVRFIDAQTNEEIFLADPNVNGIQYFYRQNLTTGVKTGAADFHDMRNGSVRIMRVDNLIPSIKMMNGLDQVANSPWIVKGKP